MTEPTALFALLAPLGQLSGNGQLRETISERRNRKGDDVAFWYLSPDLVKLFNLSQSEMEAVVAEEITAINWLKLRFGGETLNVELDLEQLRQQALSLPPGPIIRDISV